MEKLQKLSYLWKQFYTAYFTDEVKGLICWIVFTMVGQLQAHSVVSFLLCTLWGGIAYATFKAKAIWWKAAIILSVFGGFLLYINPILGEFISSGGFKN